MDKSRSRRVPAPRFEPLESRMLYSAAPGGPAFTIAEGVDTAPVVEAAADGSFAVLFGRDGADGLDLFVRLYDATGAALGSESLVNPGRVASGFDLAMDDDGDFAVAFAAVGTDGQDIFTRRFASDGTPAGDAQQVNADDAGDQGGPSIAMDSDGDFVVAWHGPGADKLLTIRTQEPSHFEDYLYDDPNTYEYEHIKRRMTEPATVTDTPDVPHATIAVFARRFDAAGAARGGEFQVSQQTPDTDVKGYRDAHDPAVAMDADGDFVVAYIGDDRRERREREVAAQSYTYTYEDYDGGPDIELRSGTGPQFSYYIHLRENTATFRRYDAGGAARGDEAAAIAVDAYTDAAGPSLVSARVAMDSDGDFAVAAVTRKYKKEVDTYRDYSGYEYSYTFYIFKGAQVAARRYDAAGQPVGKPITVANTGSQQVIHRMDLDVDPSGDMLVAWDEGDVGDEYGYNYDYDEPAGGAFARRYNQSSKAVGGVIDLNDDPAAAGPAIALKSGGAFVAAYGLTDEGAQTTDIIGQLFVPATELGGSLRGKHRKVRLTDADGTTATFKLTGKGSGLIVGGVDEPFQITLGHTTRKSKLKIATDDGGDGMIELGDITIGSPDDGASLKKLRAPNAVLTGAMEVFGGLGELRLRAMRDATVDILTELSGVKLESPDSLEITFSNTLLEAGTLKGPIDLGRVQTDNGEPGASDLEFLGLRAFQVVDLLVRYLDEAGAAKTVTAADLAPMWQDIDFIVELLEA